MENEVEDEGAVVAKLTKAQKAEIERRADELFDRLNPKPFEEITVGKDECIKRVMREMGLRK